MISVDSKATIADLEKYILETTRQLENMIKGWAYEFTLLASESTPVGDYASLFTNKRYARYYSEREAEYGIPFDVGYHAGAWSADVNDDIEFSTAINSISKVGTYAKQGVANYKLGDVVFVGAEGPGFESLENGRSQQAPSGIKTKIIADMYKIDLQRYFNKG